jgi:hypothetical protein
MLKLLAGIGHDSRERDGTREDVAGKDGILDLPRPPRNLTAFSRKSS